MLAAAVKLGSSPPPQVDFHIYDVRADIEGGGVVMEHPKFAQTEVIILKVLDFFMVAFDPRTQPRTKCLEAPRSWLRSIEGPRSWLRSIDYFSQREK